jgi:hypothetical protein
MPMIALWIITTEQRRGFQRARSGRAEWFTGSRCALEDAAEGSPVCNDLTRSRSDWKAHAGNKARAPTPPRSETGRARSAGECLGSGPARGAPAPLRHRVAGPGAAASAGASLRVPRRGLLPSGAGWGRLVEARPGAREGRLLTGGRRSTRASQAGQSTGRTEVKHHSCSLHRLRRSKQYWGRPDYGATCDPVRSSIVQDQLRSRPCGQQVRPASIAMTEGTG